MNSMKLDKMTALGGAAPYALVEISEAFDWSAGKKGDCIGMNYTVLRTVDMEKQRVFVPNTESVVSAEVIENGVATFQFVRVDFDGVTAKAIVDKSGGIRIYAEATSVKVISPNGAQKGGQ